VKEFRCYTLGKPSRPFDEQGFERTSTDEMFMLWGAAAEYREHDRPRSLWISVDEVFDGFPRPEVLVLLGRPLHFRGSMNVFHVAVDDAFVGHPRWSA
jgi:hypothetical protein